jgi:hypothetical protein
MPGSIAAENRSGVLQWIIVLGVGALVVTVVLALNLIPRLNGGQKVLNAAKPAFASQRLQADVAGINIISHNVDMADPIVSRRAAARPRSRPSSLTSPSRSTSPPRRRWR